MIMSRDQNAGRSHSI